MSPVRAMRAIGSLLSGSGPRAKLLILTYHRVLPHADPLLSGTVDAATFGWHMSLLAERFVALPLAEAVTRLKSGTLPSRAVCITFDDGYADNSSVTLPILLKYELTATFFIATGFLDGGRMWNDTVIESIRRAQGDGLDLQTIGLGKHSIGDMQARRRTVERLLTRLKYLPIDERLRKAEALVERVGKNLPDDLMMTSEQVRQMHAAGMEIGAHTHNHPILAQLAFERAEAEILQCRARLSELGIPEARAFAYPNGRPGKDYDRSHVEAVRRAGFRIAVSTAWGCARRDSDTLQLPRVAPWDNTPTRFNLRLLKTYFDAPAAVA